MAKQKKTKAGRAAEPRTPGRGTKGIHAVAELAGVSIATVSRVVNGVQNVDPKLSRRVMKAVADVEYVPNRHAQALISGRTRLVGLVVSEIVNPFFPELIQGFEEAAAKQGFSVLIGSTYAAPDRTSDWVQRMLQHGVEGVAILTFAKEPATVFESLKGKHAVQIALGEPFDGVEEVVVDYKPGMRQAVQHLAALGHRDIVFAGGRLDDPTSSFRAESFRTFMREIGIVSDPASQTREEHTLEGGIAAAKRILSLPRLPTGVICSNDLMAIGALKCFHAEGLQVPDDISLIGLDDIHLAEFTTPPLTTIRIPRLELAQTCFDTLFRALRPEEAAAHSPRVVATNLVVRESTNYPRQVRNLRFRKSSHK